MLDDSCGDLGAVKKRAKDLVEKHCLARQGSHAWRPKQSADEKVVQM
jgi:hypothetical protein